ncbi:MAG: PDZ domain-containing protein [Streptosporangiaceae bacterium]|jgi:PDZ domain-containing protein|nr:PDZ/DHR/GLGF domain-containing protein [Actinomycetota bacterium]
MSRRSATLLVAGIGALAALIVAVLLPVPYVALTPGPTLNTLGSLSGQPLIQIKGHPTYPTTGHLNMVTVRYLGGPGTNFNVFAALGSWLTPQDAVVPESEIFTPGQTTQQVLQQDTEEMVSSQQTATAAALCQLNISFTTVDTVQKAVRGMPAYGVLHAGDVITAVNGTPVTCRHDAAALIRATRPGAPITLTIRRDGKTQQVSLRTADVQGQAEVGVEVAESFSFPFSVKIDIGNIGGPSAGLMFALGIIDKLTSADLTGGRFIAGTGEIEADGTVDPIGGIQQKMAGARAAGAAVFLSPAANCPDTSGAVPAGLRLIKVSTLAGAIADLNAIKHGQPVPSC